MANYNNINELFTDICNKLRIKLGTTELIKHNEIAEKIASIPVGGGSGEFSGEFVLYAYNNTNIDNESIQYIINTINNNPNVFYDIPHMFYKSNNLNELTFNLQNGNVTNTYGLFYNCNNLTSLDVSNFNTSKSSNMGYMFANCQGLTSLDVSNFNTSNVRDMGYMFYYCQGLTSLDVSNFNTSNVVNMENMFYNCSKLTSLDVSNFNTSNVKDMNYLFGGCSGLTSLDVSNFNTSKVIRMSNLFYNNKGLTSLNVSNFNTSNVETMNQMFILCSSLTSLDVSNFNTSKVTDMGYMFYGCSGLTSLDISNFDTSNVTSVSSMFHRCSNLSALRLGTNFKPKSNNISLFDSNVYQDIELNMNGNTDFSNYDGAATFNLATIWHGSDATKISKFEIFANSLGSCTSSYTRTIKIYTELYNVLSDTQKALITDKGYALSYGTS